MDTYSLTFDETTSDKDLNFIRERVTVKQVLWFSRVFIALPKDQKCLDELQEQSWLKVEKFATGDSYQNKWGVVYDATEEDETEYLD